MVLLPFLKIKEKIINEEQQQFLLLFHHKLENNNFFTDYNNFLYSIKKNKYSLMKFLDGSLKIGEYFTFLIEYPESNCFLYWNQKVNPLDAEHNSEVSIDSLLNTCPNAFEFKGLTKYDKQSYTFLDGTADQIYQQYWLYSIGQRTNWEGRYQMPGFSDSMNPILTEVALWIKFNNMSILSHFVINFTLKMRHFFSHSIFCFTYCFVFS